MFVPRILHIIERDRPAFKHFVCDIPEGIAVKFLALMRVVQMDFDAVIHHKIVRALESADAQTDDLFLFVHKKLKNRMIFASENIAAAEFLFT